VEGNFPTIQFIMDVETLLVIESQVSSGRRFPLIISSPLLKL
jgi:hypothetical protein